MASTKSFDKIIEEIKGMSLIEVAELVKALEEEFGVSAAMPMAAPVAASAASEGAAVQRAQAHVRRPEDRVRHAEHNLHGRREAHSRDRDGQRRQHP